MELEEIFCCVYDQFKNHFYQEIFRELPDRESNLTATEAFAVEIIHTMGEPTVGEFADFVHISLPNATYRINSLVRKGYIEKRTSESDHREIHLHLTDHFYHYYNISSDYIHRVMEKMKKRLSQSECSDFIRSLQVMLNIIDECEENDDECENNC